MITIKNLGITCLFLIITLLQINGQTTLRGEIMDGSFNEPLIGASVIIQGTTDGTITEYDGTFELKTNEPLPLTLTISYVGYKPVDYKVTDANAAIKVKLEEDAITTEVVEVKGQRISEKQRSSPLTVESMDLLAIKETPSDNFYDGLGSLKGVDLTAASLGFKVVNTRGFNSTSPVRSLQIIDGVDNQAPGLNFSLGNFLGSSELDVLKVDLVQGASSAFYGPNAFNGVISMETKNPFFQKGLSAMVKGGERNLLETAVRYADVVNNKDGLPFFAYKFNLSYLRADDWEAENYDPVYETDTDASNPGRYDAVNIYGDEYFAGFDFSTFDLHTYPGLGIWHRTGYKEIDLVDYDTRNGKANAAFHFRTKPEQAEMSPEFIVSSSFGTGTTVYQGDNRFSLRNIVFFQNRLEYRKRDKFFIRAYATHEGSGDSYDPYFTALLLQDSAKTNVEWAQDYVDYWLQGPAPTIQNAEGFPELFVDIDPVTFEVTATFDVDAAEQWLAANQGLLTQWHSEAEVFANQQSSPTGNVDFYEPGTARFEQEFNEITSKLRTDGGTRFFDQSALYHVHGEYTFTPKFADLIRVGGNVRYYLPVSQGTIFSDTAGTTITNSEFGVYAGLEKSLFDKRLKLQGTIRADKNQNFDVLLSPAASVVYKPSSKNYLRVSFSSAIRNPTLSDQYLLLDVGRATLAGNLNGVQDLVTIESLQDFLATLDASKLEFFDIDPVRPEQVRTIEIGYRTTLFEKLYVDAGYYYSVYNDFLGFNLGADLELDATSGRPGDIEVFRYAANSTNTVTTQGFAIGLNLYFKNYYMISGNYSWNRLNKTFEDDPIIPAFNTPEHKFNIGISGRNVPIPALNIKNLGFNINYKWIEGFLFEGSPQFTGFVPTYDLLDAQVNYNFKKINTTLKIGASNVLNNMQFQTYGGPRIGRLAYVSLLYDFNKK